MDLALNNQQGFICHKTKPNLKTFIKILNSALNQPYAVKRSNKPNTLAILKEEP